MPRRRVAEKRTTQPDPKFNDRLVARFVGSLIKSGKKSLAYNILYSSLDHIAEQVKDDPVKILKEALENVRPLVETKSRRVGGANYQVPVEVTPLRGEALGIRWILKAAKERPGRSMQEKLTAELIDAYNKRGSAIKKREEVHKMAESNKAFAHFRW
ncbi:MAG: 30S ribosomal protein S7 [Bdellovibrionales bacterium]|nr:30S ribosomal protein S7 [Bdellovibrionales bacterium]